VPVPRLPSGSPLSFAQQRLWFLAQLRPDDAAYNMAAAVELRGRLEAGALGDAFRQVVQRHEALRTTFTSVAGEPVQVIHPEPVEPPMTVVDLSGLCEGEVERLARVEASRPFDLESGPLLRVLLVRLGPERHLLLLTMHHLVSDAWSVGVLIREVSALYRCAGDLPPLPVQYADFAVWQRAWLQGETLERPLAWWRERLAGAPPALKLPAEPQAGGSRQPLSLPDTAGLEALARAEGTTLFVALLAGFQALLHRWTGQEDLVIGTPFANRRRAEVQGLIGFFVNTLPIRADLAGRPSFRELLRRAREQVLGVHEHQDLPFERIVEELRPERATGRNPLFQAVLAFQNVPMPALDLPGLEAIPRRVDAGMARFDLTFDLMPDEGWIEQGIFSQATAARLAAHFRSLLTAALEDPDAPAMDLPLLSAGERHQLVVEWNDRAAAVPRVPIHRLFEEQADLRPDAVAVEDGRRSLTYAELDGQANRLAWHLRELGVGPEVPVAFCLERSIEAVETVLAILKAGGAYVPLSPSFPAERLAWIMADSGARVLVTAPGTPVPPIPAGIPTIDLGRDAAAIAGRSDERKERLAEDPDPDGLAYVLYTSGSTGRPKGVAVTHRNVVRLVRGNDFTELGPDESWLLLAPLSFDASTLELWGPLLNGGRLVVFPSRVPSLEEIARTVEEQGVTSLWLTAGLFHQMLDTQAAALRRLRRLLAGGDVLSPPHVRHALEEGIALVNGYGPTEGTTFTCCELLQEAGDTTVPIGRPIANARVHVLGEGAEPVPIGVAGELLAGGGGLARGYLRRPDLTAESFVPDPFSREPGARLYRTGDRVRHLADGRIEFLGRMDRQVKIRGFRIEPGEVEAALTRHPSVADAVVVARETRLDDRRLVAYLVPRAGEPGPAASELRLFLEPTLPAPLIPSTFVILPAFPLTANGKVDRAALPAPMATEPVPGRAQPRGPVEELLARLWEEVLGGGRVGAEDGFFDLGGHSLLAVRLVSRVREVFEVELPLADLFQSPTVRSLALRIKALRRGEERPAPPVVPLSREERRAALPLSFAQERLWLFERMDPGSTVFNMPLAARFRGALDVPALARSLEEVVRRHEVLRTTFPEMAGRPVQRIAPAGAAPERLPLVDLAGLGAGLGEEAAREAARRLAQEQGLRPFDLQRELPLRMLLLRIEPEEHELLVTLHHIAADGWSLEVLVRELGVLYRAFAHREPSPLSDLPLQYADWAVWQRRWLEGEALESLRAAWRGLLEGVPTVLELPTDRPRSPAQGRHRGTVRSITLDGDLTHALEALGRPAGCTLYMTLLAAFQVLIGSLSRQDDFLIGTPVAGRSRGETEGMIGFFVNMLALRARLGDRPTFRQLLARVRETTLAAWAHQEMPFDELVRDLRPERDPGRAPLIQVVLAEQESPAWDLDLPHVSAELLPPAEVVARYDLSLTAVHRPGGLELHLTCDADLFDEATGERLLHRWVDLLRAACERPDARIDDLVEADRAPDLCVHELIEAQAQRTPDAEAVRFGDHLLSYADLSLRARCLAHRLRRLGVEPDVRVGLSTEPGPAALVGILGIWMAGGAYVPVDPGVPAARRGFFLADSGALLLVADSFLLEPGPDPGPIESGARPENLAYVLYTSGSTGVPKGVAVEHRQLARYLSFVNRVLFGGRVRSCPWITPLTFDACLKQALAPLLRGETVWGAEPSVLLAELARRDRVGVNATPSLWRALLDGIERSDAGLPGVARVFLGGERLPAELFSRTAAALPGAEIWNLYGPTEATANAAAARLAPGGPVVLGFPIEGTRLHLLDPEMEPVPPGEVGEIHIGGSGVTRGYLGKPELTAERFVPDPFGAEPGARLYRTGDLGRWTRDGIEFLGRIDHQVKLRGIRIELGEVEARLELHPGVREAAVVLAGDRLVAFVVGGEVDNLRAALAEALPEPMVPASFVLLDRLPRLPSGKVDRAALQGKFEEAPSPRPVVAPRTPTERRLAEIWAAVLGRGSRDTVSVEDNFFELGGHSIQSIQISHRAAAAGIEVTPRDLLHHPTIAGLAALVDAQQKPQVQGYSALVPDLNGRCEPFTLSDIQQAYLVGRAELFELGGVGPTSYLEADWPELDVPRLEAAWRRLVERHDMLRAVVLPDGRWQVLREVPAYEIRVEDRDPGILRDALREQMSRRLFEPGRWPLFELRVTDGRRLHVARDLLIGDAQSSEVLLQELMFLYRNPGAALRPLEVSVRDYALAVDALRAGEAGRKAWEYWRERLAGLPPSPDLPLAPKPGRPAFVRRHGEIGAEARTLLDGRAARAGITPSVLLCAAFSEVLAAWSGGDRFSINVLYSRRLPLHPQIDHLVGNFASTVLLEVDGREPTFELRAARLQERLWGDLRHGLVSGVEVLREANRLQGGSTRAAMPVVFSSVLPLARETDVIPEGPELIYSSVQTPQVALEVLVTEVAGSVRYTWNSVDDAFPPGFVTAMFEAYQSLLDHLAAGPDGDQSAWRREGRAPVPPLQLVRRRKINATAAPEPGWLLHEPIAADSDDVAVVTADRRLTYRELSREADLLSRNLPAGGLIAVVMEKGWEQAVATLAILRAGAAYLPIDPALPLERRWHLLEQGDVEVALTQPSFVEGLGWPQGVRVVAVEKNLGAGLVPAREGVNPSPTLAYVLFTSGSTGLPKGVMIDHRGAANTVADINRRFRISAADRVLALSSLSFDLSVWDLFGILGAGGRVVMPDPEASRDPAHWHERIEREGVTVWSSVPALMELYADYLESHGLTVPASLRLVMLSGDWIPVPLPGRLRALGSRAELISLGGATEASIWSVLFPVREVDPAWRSIPYGRPMANQTLHVLDKRLDPSPDWVPGQLYLGGIGLALGYWKDEAKTRASFIIHPWTGERLYRTGDLGRWLPDGNVELLGREDLQVKIQGYRVEPGEIETALALHPAVREAVVTAAGEARGHKRLVAYVVLRHSLEPAELRAWLEARLPDYMVPHLYVQIGALPLTANGKVDRKALPAPEPARRPSRAPASESDRPRSTTETRMARLWEEVLGVSPVGLDDDLFALGGDSLLALRLLDAIEKELGRRLPLGALFQEATVEKLAALVESTAP
jgi:amino acid adenylation domain-containing protein